MISIIVPIYNAEQYLNACVESLLNQTVKDIEVILIDDSSTDSSLAIAQAFAAQDSRVKVLQEFHAGQSVARNMGMAHARGEYIAFVDADDQLELDWCERHLAVIEGVDYVQSGYTRISPEGKRLNSGCLPKHPYQFTSPCMRLYKLQAISRLRFSPGFIYEDVLFSTDLWLSGARSKMIDHTGYLYTLNPNSTTAHPHPDAQRKVLRALNEKAKGQPIKGKLIVWYTMIRLKLHFLLR